MEIKILQKISLMFSKKFWKIEIKIFSKISYSLWNSSQENEMWKKESKFLWKYNMNWFKIYYEIKIDVHKSAFSKENQDRHQCQSVSSKRKADLIDPRFRRE